MFSSLLLMSREGRGIGASRPSMLILASAALALTMCPSNANLIIDVRAIGATGSASVQDMKHVLLDQSAAAGSTVTLGIYAVVRGAVGNTNVDEQFVSALFGMATYGTGPKNIRGNLSSLVLNDAFARRSLTYGGALRDLNGDGDLDIGDPFITQVNNARTYIYVNSGGYNGDIPGFSTDLPGNPAGREWFLGTGTFTVTDLLSADGDSIFANAFIPIYTAADGTTSNGFSLLNNKARSLYTADGASDNGGSGSAPHMFAGDPVSISPSHLASAPEPGSVSLLFLGIAAAGSSRKVVRRASR